MFRTLPLFLLLLAGNGYLPPETQPLRVAGPDGRGPLALLNLNHHPLGAALVDDDEHFDLFVSGSGGRQAVYLCCWVATAESGAPVFAPPVEVETPLTNSGTVFQTHDGQIHGLWIAGSNLVHTTFDRQQRAFRQAGRMALGDAIRSPQNLAAILNGDGSVDLAFELSAASQSPAGDPWTEAWRPFNSSGIAAGTPRFRYLAGATIPALLSGPLQSAGQISSTNREVFFGMYQLAPVNLGRNHRRDLIVGSRQGTLAYYRNTAETGWQLEPQRLVAGPDGNALRHPTINAGVCAYPHADGTSDLIAAGEGELYFYRYTGQFTPGGAPIYRHPVPVLQQHADLYAGTLPSPSVVDFNGDGVLDIVSGNSAGHVVYFQNVGTNEAPQFLAGTLVEADGHPIHVQAGYAGSVQGLQEARWGYLSPNVTDWNGDGLPDILTGDITGNFQVYLNRGVPGQPRFAAACPLYCHGLNLHGMWRVRPAVGQLAGRLAMVIVDGDDHLHLYWRIDDYNVADGGKLLLDDDSPIGVSSGPAGHSGRAKLDLFDWNQDGQLDLIIGTSRVNSIPDRATGLPMPAIGKRTLGTPLLMLNVGTSTAPRFSRPVPFRDRSGTIIQPGGAHETGAVGTMLGGNGPNLLVCHETGRLYLLPGRTLRTAAP